MHTTSKGAYSDIFITKTDKADVQLTTILINSTGKLLQIAFTTLMRMTTIYEDVISLGCP